MDRSGARRMVERSLGRLLGRDVVILPKWDPDSIYSVDYGYRVGGDMLEYVSREPAGSVTFTLSDWTDDARVIASFSAVEVSAQDRFTVDLTEREVHVAGTARLTASAVGDVSRSRRFITSFRAETSAGTKELRVGQYLVWKDTVADQDYFEGAEYHNYEGYPRGLAVGAVKRVLERRSPPATLLDVGCAYGFLVKEAERAGFSATGIDSSADAVARARELVPGATFVVADAETGLELSDRFDVVTMNSVLEHFHHPDRALESAASVMHSGGWLFIKTMNADSMSRHLFGGEWEGYVDYTHHSIDRMTPRGIGEMLQRAGFDVIDIHTTTGPFVTNPDPYVSRFAAAGLIPGFREAVDRRMGGDFLYVTARRSA